MKLKLCILSLMLLGSLALADKLVTKGISRNGDILGYSGFVVTFRNPNGIENTYPLAAITSIEIEGLDEFNAAEALRTKKKYDEAIEKYDVAASRTRQAYHKLLIRDRSYMTMQQAGLTAQAVKTWITITKAARYTRASLGIVPATFSAKGDEENTSAIAVIDKELSRLKRSDRSWKKAKDAGFISAALRLKMAIATHDGNEDLVAKTAEALQELNRAPATTDPTGPTGPTGPAVTTPKPAVDTTFGGWELSLQTKKFTALITELTAAYPKLPRSRKPGALLMLGRAHLARSATADAEKADLLDAGLYFLAVFVEDDESRHVPEALYRLAQINKQLGNTAGYRQVLSSLIEMYGYDRRSDWVKKARAETPE